MAMPPIQVYQPAIKVTLFKTVGRKTTNGTTPVSTRFAGTPATIDLTAWLSESSTVQTAKSVREPAGAFTISLVDKPLAQGGGSLESLYGLIEPMDFIEIRFQHGSAVGPSLPVVMRGFVSKVRRSESMSQDGKPQEQVTVTGQDYGKLWQQLQIMYYPGYVVGENIISSFKLFERFGVLAASMPVQQFVATVIQKVLAPYLLQLMPPNSPNPTTILLDGITVAHGTTAVSGPQNYQGSVYDILRTYGDVGIWNELYLEDRDDGVHLIFRPTPFLDTNVTSSSSDLSGNLIQGAAGAVVPTVVDVPSEDIVSFEVERSDANVANYYWVKAPEFNLNSEIYRQLFAIQGSEANSVLLTSYPNSAANLYGIRVMEADTQLGADDVTTFSSGQPAKQQVKRNGDMVDWISQRRAVMAAENKDNVVLETATMVMRGNEQIRAGMYIRARRGAFMALFYVVAISHRYTPFGLFVSTLQLERGMGFVERVRMSASPYLAERLGDLIGG